MSQDQHNDELEGVQGGEGSFDRRAFLKSVGAVAAGGVVADLGLTDPAFAAARGRRERPNIVFIIVDQMRFPKVFPQGIETPQQWLQTFMPNTFELWRNGAKFTEHYTATMACSPSRASMVTGLHAQQHYLLIVRGPTSPELRPDFPTYGKILRRMGYQTPYFGKWHISNVPKRQDRWLEAYGFNGHVVPGKYPDPHGANGEGQAVDGDIADEAIAFLSKRRGNQPPFCATVSLVNPHDQQWWWGAVQAEKCYKSFEGSPLKPVNTSFTTVPASEPPHYGYPSVPPNWETDAQLLENKPGLQTVWRAGLEAAFLAGGTYDASQREPSVEPYPPLPQFGRALGDFSVWQRGLDHYTYVASMVDEHIGRVVASVPKDLIDNTVFVMTSDHGDYAGAHGLLTSKLGTAYQEVIHVPLIVADPSRRFVKRRGVRRDQFTSHVDLVRMFGTLGNGGSNSWLTRDYATMYGGRVDLMEILRDPDTPSRDHVLFSTDDWMPSWLNYLDAPDHVLCALKRDSKIVAYNSWAEGTTRPIRGDMETEFFDYATEGGRQEVENTPDDPRAKAELQKLFGAYTAKEFRKPLPRSLHASQRRARARYLAYIRAGNKRLERNDSELARYIKEDLGWDRGAH